jgi:hypothetical protein
MKYTEKKKKRNHLYRFPSQESFQDWYCTAQISIIIFLGCELNSSDTENKPQSDLIELTDFRVRPVDQDSFRGIMPFEIYGNHYFFSYPVDIQVCFKKIQSSCQ